MIYDVSKIKDHDRELKRAAGEDFDQDAIKLAKIYEGIGRGVLRDFLDVVKLGDPENPRPISPNILRRLVRTQATLYRAPPSRRLKRAGKTLADDAPETAAFAVAARRMFLDAAWKRADAYRLLLGQVILLFAEDPRRGCAVRLFEPFNTFRLPTPGAADDLDEDEAIALQLRAGTKPEEEAFLLFVRDDNGWRSWRVDGSGRMVGEQPYGDDGRLPFAELPAVLVPSEVLMGRAYVPIDESTLDLALNHAAFTSDLGFAAKFEAHSIRIIKTDSPQAVPDEVGPNKNWKIPREDEVDILGHKPQIEAINSILESNLSQLALSHGLPPDAFARTQEVANSSLAVKLKNADLDAMRLDLIPLTQEAERVAYERYSAVWNRTALERGRELLAEDCELVVSYAKTWNPVDRKEHQQVSFADMAAGLMSPVRYVMEAYGLTRDQAIEALDEARADAEAYPLRQNPASMIDGPNAPGLDATKEPGEFHPDIASSTESASLLGATQAALGVVQ